jgi:hypothetical protein
LSNADFFTVAPNNTAYVRVATTYNTTTDMTFQLNYSTSTYRTLRAARSWSLGQWYHIASVRRTSTAGVGRGVDLYVNGTVVGSTEDLQTGMAFNTWGATTMNYFGKSRDDLTTKPGLDATIDEILISCRAYTADEIKQLAYKP